MILFFVLRTGVDIIEISRLRDTITGRQGERFLARVYTSAERTLCGENYPSLAARFSAKEAVAKALGSGIGEIGWHEIEIHRGPCGEPVLELHGNALRLAEERCLTTWSLSISHTQTHAVAMAVALGEKNPAPPNS